MAAWLLLEAGPAVWPLPGGGAGTLRGGGGRELGRLGPVSLPPAPCLSFPPPCTHLSVSCGGSGPEAGTPRGGGGGGGSGLGGAGSGRGGAGSQALEPLESPLGREAGFGVGVPAILQQLRESAPGLREPPPYGISGDPTPPAWGNPRG